MPLDARMIITIVMMFPIEDLQLTKEQLAQLGEEDAGRLSEIVYSILVSNVDDIHATVREAVNRVLQEKRHGLN